MHLDEAKKLVQELRDRKKELKAAMFDNNLVSFNAYSYFGDASLGELTFANIQIPFKKLDFDSTQLQPFYIDTDYYDHFLPLEYGQCIVAFKQFLKYEDVKKCFTQMSCFDPDGRLIAIDTVKGHVKRDHVVQSAPNEFFIRHYSELPMLSVYNSSLDMLAGSSCKNYSNICCNSKFVFGVWTMDADDDDDNNEQAKPSSSQQIQVHHLDTLSEAFVLIVPKNYRIHRILADEHHVVAVCRMENDWFGTFTQFFTTVFDLATCNEIGGGGGKTANFSLPERRIDLLTMWYWIADVFLLDGWLVVPGANELAWYNKEGKRETRTELVTHKLTIFASRSVLLFEIPDSDKMLLMKRVCLDGEFAT